MSEDVFYTYRCYDERGTIVYIGYTADPPTRERCHSSTSPWWADVASIAYCAHPTELEARRTEASLIRTFNPCNNRVGTEEYVSAAVGFSPRLRRDGHCDWPGCEEIGRGADGRTLCDEHRLAHRRNLRGDQNSARGRKRLTIAECEDIRRRLARFEDPGSIARELGISRSTVFRAANRRRAPRGSVAS